MGTLLRCSFAGMALASGVFAQQASDDPLSTATTFGTTVVIPGGLRGSVYLIPKDTTVLPDFERGDVQRVGEIWTNELDIPPRHWRSGFPGLTDRFEWFAIDYSGRFWISEPGRYTFALLSDDGSRLFLDDTPVIDNDCQHPPDLRLAAVKLEGGGHRIRISYFQGPRDCLSLLLAVAGPDHRWKIFDLREFKPPSNPEEWRFPKDSSMAVVPTAPEEASLTVNSLTKRLGSDDSNRKSRIKSKGGLGCAAAAVRVCSN
jgi:PA14 domain